MFKRTYEIDPQRKCPSCRGLVPIKQNKKNKRQNSRYCSRVCYTKGMTGATGERARRWEGGIARTSTKRWRAKNRERIRQLITARQHRVRAAGEFPLDAWNRLKAEYNGVCPACRRREPEIRLTIDHIQPIAKGGTNDIKNLQPLCRSCNAKKHTKTIKYAKL